MASTSKIIENYKTFLEVKYPGNYKNFCTRLKNHPESAKAEAVLFSVLRPVFSEVKIAEDLSEGGVDFLCISDSQEFIIEVTSLDAVSVSNQSGWKNEIKEGESGGSFRMITHKLFTKVSSKANQMADKNMPRVLAITTEHSGGYFLLGPHGAQSLLTSDTQIAVPIGEPIDEVRLESDLHRSVFFELNKNNGIVEPRRQSISAILLISILSDKCLIIGILHPDPAYDLPIKLFPKVPFVRLKKWPPENNNIETEWIIHSPSMAEFTYNPIILRDDELRNI